MSEMDDKNNALAETIIRRLNVMIQTDKSVGQAIGLLMGHRVELPDKNLADHPTIQVGSVSGKDGVLGIEVGFLGMLNGIVGALPDGNREGWGYIMAVVEADGTVSSFVNTKDSMKARMA